MTNSCPIIYLKIDNAIKAWTANSFQVSFTFLYKLNKVEGICILNVYKSIRKVCKIVNIWLGESLFYPAIP